MSIAKASLYHREKEVGMQLCETIMKAVLISPAAIPSLGKAILGAQNIH